MTKTISNRDKTIKTIIIYLFSFIFFWGFIKGEELYIPPLENKIGKSLTYSLARMDKNDKINVWVFFTDKGIFEQEEYDKAISRFINNLSQRRRKRREKSGRAVIADFTDLPVKKEYVRKVEQRGAKKRVISRWFNAASFRVSKREVQKIENLPFVRKIKRVEKFYLSPEKTKIPEKRIKKQGVEEDYEFNYGGSKTQNSLIAIDKAHNNGYFGEGVRIGIFDTGFNVNPDRYEALEVVSDNIIDTWDFINDTSYVGPQHGDPPGQTDHGTSMLSLIAGFKDNELIGPAFRAQLALAKTEILDQEIMQEEDNWAAAAEWADSCGPDKGGVDIISSSLGYKSFDDTVGYSYDPHMCGDSTIITRAADLAVSKGIVVVTAMGNVTFDNPTDRPDTCIVAPADGDSVIAAGAVDTNYVSGGWKWAWIEESGTGAIIGPTFDNRTKPEVCAAWSGYHINPDYDPDAPDTAQQSKYLTGQGTSVSTAIIAGGCALVLQAHPDWAPMKLREALLNTASQHNSPDDTLGWGIANIWEAMNVEPPVQDPFENDNLAPPYPNPFRPDIHQYVVLPFNVMNQGLGGTIYIYSISGKKIREINLGSNLLPGRYMTPESGAATWDGKDNKGSIVDSGIFIVLFRTGYTSSVVKLAVIR